MQPRSLLSRPSFAPLVVTLALASGATCRAAEPVDIEDPRETREHLLGERPVVAIPWRDLTKDPGYVGWAFKVTVGADGRVVDATPADGSEAQRDDVVQAVRALRFKPFEREDHAVDARFDLDVDGRIVDYAGPADRRFPVETPPSLTSIALRRSGCYGSCPAYRVEVHGDGRVDYEGFSDVLVTGARHWRIDPAAAARLVNAARRADYFRLDGYYVAEVTDMPTYVTRVSLGEQRKFVVDYGNTFARGALASTSSGGKSPHLPRAVVDLEEAIDSVSGTLSWTRGDAHTLARLRAARYDFHAPAAADGLELLLSRCKLALAQAFIRAGAPVDGASPTGFKRRVAEIQGEVDAEGRAVPGAAVMAAAAACADRATVRMLVARGALATPAQAQAFLRAGVASGRPGFVAIALRHGARGSAAGAEGTPLLLVAAGATRRDDIHGDEPFDPVGVIESLIHAGASVDARDKAGNTALHEAQSAAIVRALRRAGADPEARNAEGRTPLFDRYDDATLAALLKAGAHVDARDAKGQTALFGLGSGETADRLIRAGADVNARGLDGLSPLETASSEDAVMRLLAAGATLPEDPERQSRWLAEVAQWHWSRAEKALERRGAADR